MFRNSEMSLSIRLDAVAVLDRSDGVAWIIYTPLVILQNGN